MKKLFLIMPIFLFAITPYYNEGLYAYLAKNYKKAEKYFKLACDKNKNAWGCFSYAQLIKDKNLQNIYLKKACKLGLKAACE